VTKKGIIGKYSDMPKLLNNDFNGGRLLILLTGKRTLSANEKAVNDAFGGRFIHAENLAQLRDILRTLAESVL
jgi:hypothetical protein